MPISSVTVPPDFPPDDEEAAPELDDELDELPHAATTSADTSASATVKADFLRLFTICTSSTRLLILRTIYGRSRQRSSVLINRQHSSDA